MDIIFLPKLFINSHHAKLTLICKIWVYEKEKQFAFIFPYILAIVKGSVPGNTKNNHPENEKKKSVYKISTSSSTFHLYC